MNIQKPVYIRDLFGGKVTVIVFGAPVNWNYAGTSREDMEAKNPGITAILEEVMRKYGIKRALVPKPAFNAKVVTDADLPNELLPNFFRGADADGVLLEKSGDAYFLASADCLAAAIFDSRTNSVVALHCGRDALMDRKRINEGEAVKREHESVIRAGVRQLDNCFQFRHLSRRDVYCNNEFGCLLGGDDEIMARLCDHSGMSAYLAAGIRPETFDHSTTDEKYGAANKRMIDHLSALPNVVTNTQSGTIDLFALVRHQLGQYWIEDIKEDEFDTATSKDAEDNFEFHSNRLRSKVERNLVIIKLN